MTERPTGALDRIRETGLIAILRGVGVEQAAQIVDALLAAGVEAVEFTADSAGATDLVEQALDRVGSRAEVGVGTVLKPATAIEAIDAGATFLVTPTVEPAVIEAGADRGVPVVAGAYTPTEAVAATRAGAAMVKIFPARTGGPAHIGAFQGPLDHLALVPTGGVTVDNAAEYIANGAAAVGVGTGLFPTGSPESVAPSAVTERTRSLLAAISAGREAGQPRRA